MGSLRDGILIDQWKTRAEAAEAEVEQLRAALATSQQSEAYARGEMARLAKLLAQVSVRQDAR